MYTIKRKSTDEMNVSQRTITYEVYLNGEYIKHFAEYDQAEDYVNEVTI